MSKTKYEVIDDEQLAKLVESGLLDASSDWLSGTTLSAEREKATLEYGMLPTGHLSPQGVSQIVSSDTVEAVDGYTAILSELLFNNNKIAKFKPYGKTPKHAHQAKVAADLTNYTIFKLNPGWAVLNTWLKAGLMYKNSVIRWEKVEDFEYCFEEYAEIDQNTLDMILSEEDVEAVGQLEYDGVKTVIDGEETYINVYRDVRLRRKKDKSRIKISNVPTENFRISKDASSIGDATFVGIETELTRGEVRKLYPDMDIDWGTVRDVLPQAKMMPTEQATRKILAGVEAHAQGRGHSVDTEANTPVQVVECWMRVDRDGDGIAELKHIFYVGGQIGLEEDAKCVPLSDFNPFEIPYEYHGLSLADMTRPSTLASTAILRGFIENVYMTNYAPKLADPNVVDFSALQNMKPKQVIPTTGNPNGAVAALIPETISQGTVPLLEFLQLHKEQSHGLSKAAQGLNDTLYVSGNSETKVSMVQSAAQTRIQYLARRLVETGVKRLVEGVYSMLREGLKGKSVDYYDSQDILQSVDPAELPSEMILEIDADVGEFGNTNMLKKMEMVAKGVIPALQDGGAGAAIKPSAALTIAANTLQALDLDPLDYLEDFSDPAFLEKAEQSRQNEMKAAAKAKALQEEQTMWDIEQRKATVALTNVQSKNALQDNARQLVIAWDKHYQDWAKLAIEAAAKGVGLPDKAQPNLEELMMKAMQIVSMDASAPMGNPDIKSAGVPAESALPVPGSATGA